MSSSIGKRSRRISAGALQFVAPDVELEVGKPDQSVRLHVLFREACRRACDPASVALVLVRIRLPPQP